VDAAARVDLQKPETPEIKNDLGWFAWKDAGEFA